MTKSKPPMKSHAKEMGKPMPMADKAMQHAPTRKAAHGPINNLGKFAHPPAKKK